MANHDRSKNAGYPPGYQKDCSGPINALKSICKNCFNSPFNRNKLFDDFKTVLMVLEQLLTIVGYS
uniref:Uncharacterized protein n=1 Tax=Romanomermis culicivorax TaxID=13658 RepID=A0A915HN71_ROMCU